MKIEITMAKAMAGTIALALTMALGGCSSADNSFDAKGVLPSDGAIRVYQAGVNATISRAGQADDNLLPFGIFVTNPANADYSYDNVYMKQKGSYWTGFGSVSDGAAETPMLWQNATQTVSVLAYSPYNSAATINGTLQGTVVADQSADTGATKSDLLYAAKSEVNPQAAISGTVSTDPIIYDTSLGGLKVTFKHRLCKVRVNILFTSEFPQGAATPVGGVSLGNTNTAWQLSMADGSVVAATTPVNVDITMKKETAVAAGYHQSFEAVIVPQSASDMPISIKTENGNYAYLTGAQTFESGKLYTYNLAVGKEVQRVGEVSVADWNTGTISDNNKAETVISIPGLVGALAAQGVTVDPFDQCIHVDNAEVQTQLEKVTSLDLSNKNLTSLDGIQYLKNLQELSCNSNQLTSLDVSRNTALTSLDCRANKLTKLDVSNNKALVDLSCGENELTSLDVVWNNSLKQLVCSYNKLASLNVSNNPSLTLLYCHGNKLTSLNLFGNRDLADLMCQENQLSSLDITRSMLTRINCGSQKDANGGARQLTLTLTSEQHQTFTDAALGSTVTAVERTTT